MSGHLIATIVVAAGIGTLVASHPLALTVLTVAGASYLLWLGINMLASPSTPHADEIEASNSWRRWALKGLCVSGLNPKVFLLFLALLPQFAHAAAPWPIPLQMIALGLVHTISCGAVYLMVGFGSKAVLHTRPAAARFVSRFSGAAMIIIAVILLFEQMLG